MTETRYAKVLVNPIAGGRKEQKLCHAVVDALRHAGVKCDVTISRFPGELTELSGQLATQGCETIIVCGGDGTAHEVINGIAGSETALAVLPLGAANDFSVNMGFSQDITHICELIKKRRTKRIDLVKVNQDRFFCGTACLGFGAEVAAFARSRKIEPHMMHLLGGLVKFFSYEPRTIELRFNGQRFFGDVFLAAFGNVKSYARGTQNTPEASFDDALLDICLVKRMPKRRLISFFQSVHKGTQVTDDGIEQFQTKAVFVQSVGPADLYADGEFAAQTPVRLEVVPKALNVILAPRSQEAV